MERPALAAFDIKPLQFSLEEAKKEKKKEKLCTTLKMWRKYLKPPLFSPLLRQFQDLERKEINAEAEMWED